MIYKNTTIYLLFKTIHINLFSQYLQSLKCYENMYLNIEEIDGLQQTFDTNCNVFLSTDIIRYVSVVIKPWVTLDIYLYTRDM